MNEKFICPECNRKFPSKRSLAQHKKWHKPGYRENHTGKNHPNYGKFGAENPMFGKRGEESSNWKNDKAGRSAIHRWIRIY